MKNHWEEALYTKTKKKTIEMNYLYDPKKILTTKSMFDYIDNKTKLNQDSTVIEFGCNVGRNLREARLRYNCKITGLDINKECIQKNKDFFKDDRSDFIVSDLRNSNCLSKYQDKFFDVGVTMGFLMHIPYSTEKVKLVKQIIRVCKKVCIFEMFSTNIYEKSYENEWHISFEDYRLYDENIELTNVVAAQREDLKLFVYGFK